MPAEDSGDVILRHRTAVLDALLSDPSFSETGAGIDTPELSGPLTGEPTEALDDLAHAIGGLPPEAAGRRSADGPKASERIIALLNGQTSDSAPALDFSSDFSEAASRTAPAESASAGAETRGSSAKQPEFSERVTKVVTHLKNPKVALAVCAVMAVLLVLALMTTGGKDETKRPQQLAVVTPTAAPSSKPEQSAVPTSGGPLQVKAAQSHCPSGSTPGMDAFSGQQGKAWSCVRAFKVDGQVLTIDLGKSYQVDSIGIVPGWDSVGTDGSDQWAKYRTVSRVSYQFDDSNKTTYTQQTLDQRTLVVTKMEPPVSASKITLTVLQSKGEQTINTVAISSIVITGH
ncbi:MULTISPECIES: discoidin domain-containing protein [unclassified Nocardia]|uniref:discoidin domain-containing protein n=1 Tax=unclassified Nocardia TaxID=2637762 RepID=UPI00343E9FE4